MSPVVPAVAFIDGLNFFHGASALNEPRLMWSDPAALARKILAPNERLDEARFYTAHPRHLAERAQRLFRAHVGAMRLAGTTVIAGEFKQKRLAIPGQWRAQNPSIPRRLVTHEEKETDVRIALDILECAYEGRAGRILLATADGDLRPAVERILRNFPQVAVTLATPPKTKGRRGFQVYARQYPGRFQIRPIVRDDLAACRLPDIVRGADGKTVECPREYS